MNTVIIQTQYRENYGAHEWNSKGDCPQFWKDKGVILFELIMDTDFLLYEKDDCIEVFKKMLAEKSNDYESFEYISYDVIWSKPYILDSDKFLNLIQNIKK